MGKPTKAIVAKPADTLKQPDWLPDEMWQAMDANEQASISVGNPAFDQSAFDTLAAEYVEGDDDDSEDDVGETTEQEQPIVPAAVANAVAITGGGMYATAVAIAHRIQSDKQLSDDIAAFVSEKTESKRRPMQICMDFRRVFGGMKDIALRVPGSEMDGWPIPGTVHKDLNIKGPKATGNQAPDKYPLQKGYGSYYADVFASTVNGAALQQRLDDLTTRLASIKKEGGSDDSPDNLDAEIKTVRAQINAGAEAIRNAVSLHLQLNRAAEYAGIQVRIRTVREGGRLELARTRDLIVVRADNSTGESEGLYKLFSATNFLKLDFDAANNDPRTDRFKALMDTIGRDQSDKGSTIPDITTKNVTTALGKVTMFLEATKNDAWITAAIKNIDDPQHEDVANAISKAWNALNGYYQALKAANERLAAERLRLEQDRLAKAK